MKTSQRGSFNLRTFTLALSTCTFVMLAIASIALFLAPSCAVARASAWSFLGITKDSWKVVNGLAGFLAVFVGIVYFVMNGAPIRGRIRGDKKPAREWLAGVAVCCFLGAGIVAHIPPFSYVTQWHESHEHPAGSAGVGGCSNCSGCSGGHCSCGRPACCGHSQCRTEDQASQDGKDPQNPEN